MQLSPSATWCAGCNAAHSFAPDWLHWNAPQCNLKAFSLWPVHCNIIHFFVSSQCTPDNSAIQTWPTNKHTQTDGQTERLTDIQTSELVWAISLKSLIHSPTFHSLINQQSRLCHWTFFLSPFHLSPLFSAFWRHQVSKSQAVNWPNWGTPPHRQQLSHLLQRL